MILAAAISGAMLMWSHYSPPLTYDGLGWRVVKDTFYVSVPDTGVGVFSWRVGGETFTFPARSRPVPRWSGGATPQWEGDSLAATPGVAWETYYLGDTLTFWGYSIPGYVIGRMHWRTSRVHDGARVQLEGMWHSLP